MTVTTQPGTRLLKQLVVAGGGGSGGGYDFEEVVAVQVVLEIFLDNTSICGGSTYTAVVGAGGGSWWKSGPLQLDKVQVSGSN